MMKEELRVCGFDIRSITVAGALNTLKVMVQGALGDKKRAIGNIGINGELKKRSIQVIRRLLPTLNMTFQEDLFGILNKMEGMIYDKKDLEDIERYMNYLSDIIPNA